MTNTDASDSGPSSVLLISYHFGDAQEVGARRATAIAKQLVARGIRVSVICAGSQDSRDASASLDVVRIRDPGSMVLRPLSRLFRRLRGPKLSAAGSEDAGAGQATIGRNRVRDSLFRWLFLVDDRKKWALKAVLSGIAVCRAMQPDVIVCTGPPMSSVVAAALVSRLMRRNLLLDFRDPWVPDSVAIGSGPGGLPTRIERRIRAWCLRRASRFTGASPGIVSLLESDRDAAGRHIELALNGYDEVYDLKPPVQNILSLIYAGTLYLNRNPFPLLEAVDDLLADGVFNTRNVSVTIVGSFERWTVDDVRMWARGRAIEPILTLLGPVRKQQLMPMYEAATVLVNIATGQPNQIPAKSFEYLAAGREVLTLTESDSDTSWLMQRAGRGRSADPSDAAALRDVLTDLYRCAVNPAQSSSNLAAPPEFARERAIEPMMSAIIGEIRHARSVADTRRP